MREQRVAGKQGMCTGHQHLCEHRVAGKQGMWLSMNGVCEQRVMWLRYGM